MARGHPRPGSPDFRTRIDLRCGESIPYTEYMSTRELINKELEVLPEILQLEVYDFVRFLKSKSTDSDFNGLLASEAVLSRDWDTPEEDAAWANL
jgi:hypothetical protein